MISLPITQIRANDYNPNFQTADETNLLIDNIDRVGFLDPILVVQKGEDSYEICDGEHRFRAMQVLGFTEIPCIIADPETFDLKTQKLQTVRLNKIRGQLDLKKFNTLVDNLIDSGEVSPEEAAYSLGFADEDEFALVRDSFRESLPNKEAKKEFDKKVKEAKSVDEIYTMVMELIRKYSSGLPANYMIIAVGRGRNLWCLLDGTLMRDFEQKARECLDAGVTFDSFVVNALNTIDAKSFIEEHREDLNAVGDEIETVDDLFEYNDGADYEEVSKYYEEYIKDK